VRAPSARIERTFDALGDPTRRSILRLLARGPQPVGALAARLPVSRPAVSQHLRVLERARLVQSKAQGRRTVVALAPEGFTLASQWLDSLWPEALERFRALAEQSWRDR
jgi:DNA-binding transcriptional ArsR family regulator